MQFMQKDGNHSEESDVSVITYCLPRVQQVLRLALSARL